MRRFLDSHACQTAVICMLQILVCVRGGVPFDQGTAQVHPSLVHALPNDCRRLMMGRRTVRRALSYTAILVRSDVCVVQYRATRCFA